jgi:hypothetical protein
MDGRKLSPPRIENCESWSRLRISLVDWCGNSEPHCAGGGIRWLPLTESIFKRAEAAFLAAPADVYLRAANALHLACAAKHGFAEIHSNDRHLLSAAPLFSVRGVNLITPCAKALRLRVLPTAPLPACRGDRVPNQQDQQVLEAAMKVKYDQEVDVLTIEFSKAPGGGE